MQGPLSQGSILLPVSISDHLNSRRDLFCYDKIQWYKPFLNSLSSNIQSMQIRIQQKSELTMQDILSQGSILLPVSISDHWNSRRDLFCCEKIQWYKPFQNKPFQ